MLKRLFAVIMCLFLSTNISAEIIYKELNKPNFDYAEIPLSKLALDASRGDSKARYLLALHRIHGDHASKVIGVKSLEKLAASGILDANQLLYKINSWVKVESLTKEKSLAYLKAGAEGGYACSQMDLATVYDRGLLGEPQNLSKFYYWVEKAAEQGHAEALALTASANFVGRGVPRNDVKGFEWLIRAFNVLGKDFNRWEMLAAAYEEGRGTSVDLAKAYMCFDLMGTAGIEEKARIAPRMTAAQRAEGLRLSQEWQQKNHVYTMQSLGLKRQKDGSYQ